jgi:hypothetical protein
MLRIVLAAAAIFALLAAACGGGDDNSSNSSSVSGEGGATASDDSDKKSAAQALPGGGSGVVVLNGESHDVNNIIRCELTDDSELEGSLDLAVLAENSQLQVLINVGFSDQVVPAQSGYENKVLQNQSIDLQGPAAKGLWGITARQSVMPPNFDPIWTGDEGTEIDGPPLTVSGDHLSGTFTLNDFNDTPATVDLSVDITIPSDEVNCRLR